MQTSILPQAMYLNLLTDHQAFQYNDCNKYHVWDQTCRFLQNMTGLVILFSWSENNSVIMLIID